MFGLKHKILLWGQRRIEKGAWVFAPISLVWGGVSFCKNFLYDHGIFSQVKVRCIVVSIGNLVAGGTGKTPLAVLLSSYFSEKRIAILSRGYGNVADEALLLARRVPAARVYVGKDRGALAKQAVQDGAELIFIDDGFQYRKLYRDFDLVTLSGEDPFGKGHYLPFGFLRDSPKRLKKADAIFVMGDLKTKEISAYTQLETKVNRVVDVETGVEKVIEAKKVALFSGIARPHLFRKTVEKQAIVVLEKILGDHEGIGEKDLHLFAMQAKSYGATALLCTEKDYVKVPKRSFPLPCYFLEISSNVVKGEDLLEKLIEKIAKKIDNLHHE